MCLFSHGTMLPFGIDNEVSYGNWFWKFLIKSYKSRFRTLRDGTIQCYKEGKSYTTCNVFEQELQVQLNPISSTVKLHLNKTGWERSTSTLLRTHHTAPVFFYTRKRSQVRLVVICKWNWKMFYFISFKFISQFFQVQYLPNNCYSIEFSSEKIMVTI